LEAYIPLDDFPLTINFFCGEWAENIKDKDSMIKILRDRSTQEGGFRDHLQGAVDRS